MKKRDLILIVALMIISAAGVLALYRNDQGGAAYVYVGGNLYGRYDLSEVTDIHIDNGNGLVNDISISDGKVYMKNATCPNKLCMKCGAISRNNESICCAPAGILITVRSDEGSEYDAITK